MAAHSSTLAWKIPWTEEPGGLRSMRSLGVGHDCITFNLLQHVPSYLGFSYLGHGVSLHGCSSKVQPLLVTLDEEYLLTTALPDLQCGLGPLGPSAPRQPWLWVSPLAAAPGLGLGVAPPIRLLKNFILLRNKVFLHNHFS